MISSSEEKKGKCRLCGIGASLQLSHILPAFAFRWLRESAANGHLRSTIEPNVRVQDGIKRYMLCAKCEGVFSRWEQAFATRLFYPYLKAPGLSYQYSDWLLHFCCSVSWRVLRLALDEGNFETWDADAMQRAADAEKAWRDYLLGDSANPGDYRQHVVVFDYMKNASEGWSPSINRYLLRAVHMDICTSPRSIFTYAKLGRFVLLGFIRMDDPASWRGTKIHATQGFIEPRKLVVPRAFGGYLNEKAMEARAKLDRISEKQKLKIDAAVLANAESFRGSDAFSAIQADVGMFGRRAFSGSEKD